MKRAIAKSFHKACVIVMLLTGTSSAAPIPLFNTGVDGGGITLGAGVSDTHWQIHAFTPGAGPQSNQPVVGGQATTISDTTFYASNTIGADGFRWIGNGNTTLDNYSAGGTYTYRQTFDLVDRLLDTVAISGDVAADDGWQLFVNGTLVASNVFTGSNSPWASLVNFTVTSASLELLGGSFLATGNTLDFVVANVGNGVGPNPPNGGSRHGLLVANLSGTAVLVPELQSSAAATPLALLALACLFLVDKRRKVAA